MPRESLLIALEPREIDALRQAARLLWRSWSEMASEAGIDIDALESAADKLDGRARSYQKRRSRLAP